MTPTPCCTIDFHKYYSALDGVSLLNCQGTVVRVSGSTVESAGPVIGLGELCGIHIRGGRRVLAEVVGFRNDHLILLPLEHIEGISPGDAVTARTTPRHILLSEAALGRVLNGLGEPIDGKGPLTAREARPVEARAPGVVERQPVTEPLQTGLKCKVDANIIGGLIVYLWGVFFDFSLRTRLERLKQKLLAEETVTYGH